jgi:hypothetical protein
MYQVWDIKVVHIFQILHLQSHYCCQFHATKPLYHKNALFNYNVYWGLSQEFEDGLNMNGTLQVLVYDDHNVVGRNINTKRETQKHN